MPRRIYRVCRASHAHLDGAGAQRVGGRWNSPGRPVIYMAETVSLAVLENLVHMGREDFPTSYVVVAATVPDNLNILTEEALVMRFRLTDPRQLGDLWIEEGASAVVEAHSRVVPLEHNYLLNPRHPDFTAIQVEPPVPFVFDERLFGARP